MIPFHSGMLLEDYNDAFWFKIHGVVDEDNWVTELRLMAAAATCLGAT